MSEFKEFHRRRNSQSHGNKNCQVLSVHLAPKPSHMLGEYTDSDNTASDATPRFVPAEWVERWQDAKYSNTDAKNGRRQDWQPSQEASFVKSRNR